MIRKPRFIVALAVGLLSSDLAAHAQTQTASQGPPNALQGFSQNRDQPVHIEAATLEVRDKQKQATFSGDVRVKQGDTGLRCKSLVVFYEQSGEPTDSGKTLRPRARGQAASSVSSALRRAAALWLRKKIKRRRASLAFLI
jgi:lipopolysaccharide export system protein LptA